MEFLYINMTLRGLHNNNNNLFIYNALFNMLGDQKRITTINNLKTIQIVFRLFIERINNRMQTTVRILKGNNLLKITG